MKLTMQFLAERRKAIIATGAFLVMLGETVADLHLTADEISALVVAFGTIFGVYFVPNEDTKK